VASTIPASRDLRKILRGKIVAVYDWTVMPSAIVNILQPIFFTQSAVLAHNDSALAEADRSSPRALPSCPPRCSAHLDGEVEAIKGRRRGYCLACNATQLHRIAIMEVRWRSLLEVLNREPAQLSRHGKALWFVLIGIIFVFEVAWIWLVVYLILRWFR
jgi:hypothetical protein